MGACNTFQPPSEKEQGTFPTFLKEAMRVNFNSTVFSAKSCRRTFLLTTNTWTTSELTLVTTSMKKEQFLCVSGQAATINAKSGTVWATRTCRHHSIFTMIRDYQSIEMNLSRLDTWRKNHTGTRQKFSISSQVSGLKSPSTHGKLRECNRSFYFVKIFSIFYYATINTETSVYVFGGWNGRKDIGIVAEFEADQWWNLGDLKQPRHGHSAVFNGKTVLVIGGSGK